MKIDRESLNRLTLAETEAVRAALVSDLEDVQAQLSQKDKRHPDGRRWTSVEYHDWRGRAVWARKKIVEDLRAVNARIKELKRHNANLIDVPAVKNPNDAGQLLYSLHRMVRGLCRDGVELDPDEQALMDLTREHLNRHFGGFTEEA